MPTQRNTYAKLKGILSNYVYDPIEIHEDANLQSDLGVYESDLENVLVDIEDEFEITLYESDIEGVNTVRELLEAILEKM